MKLTPHQDTALDLALTNLRQGKNFILGGYAGTGKTTTLKALTQRTKSRCAFCTPTGMAAHVLRQKGIDASTIHALIYNKVSDDPLRFEKRPTLDTDFIICDEASMISRDIYDDLLSYKKPILFVGDPFQLEPIGDAPLIMSQCDFVLTEVQRQAANSPILRFATAIRTGEEFTRESCEGLIFARPGTKQPFSAFDQILCGFNKTRININERIRSRLKRASQAPEVGDKLIILRNAPTLGLYNGKLVNVTKIQRPSKDAPQELTVTDGQQTYKFQPWWKFFYDPSLPVQKAPFGTIPCDFAYAITCHKAQGSEWPTIAVLDEAFGDDPRRWQYTAITRAAKNLVWISTH